MPRESHYFLPIPPDYRLTSMDADGRFPLLITCADAGEIAMIIEDFSSAEGGVLDVVQDQDGPHDRGGSAGAAAQFGE